MHLVGQINVVALNKCIWLTRSMWYHVTPHVTKTQEKVQTRPRRLSTNAATHSSEKAINHAPENVSPPTPPRTGAMRSTKILMTTPKILKALGSNPEDRKLVHITHNLPSHYTKCLCLRYGNTDSKNHYR